MYVFEFGRDGAGSAGCKKEGRLTQPFSGTEQPVDNFASFGNTHWFIDEVWLICPPLGKAERVVRETLVCFAPILS